MQQTGKEMLLAAVCFFWVTAKMRSGANSAVHIHNMRPDHDHILAAAPDHCNNATGMIQCMCVRFYLRPGAESEAVSHSASVTEYWLFHQHSG